MREKRGAQGHRSRHKPLNKVEKAEKIRGSSPDYLTIEINVARMVREPLGVVKVHENN